MTSDLQVTTGNAATQPPPSTITSMQEASGAAPSPLAAALDRVGDRWSLLLVEALLDGPRRFNELGERLLGIAPNILTDRLRRLERAGIVRAVPYSHRPVRMEYALTADGAELAGALRPARRLGQSARGAGRAGATAPRPVRHAARGPLALSDVLGWSSRNERRSRSTWSSSGRTDVDDGVWEAIRPARAACRRCRSGSRRSRKRRRRSLWVVYGRGRALARNPHAQGAATRVACPTSPDPMLPLADVLEQPIDRAMYIPCPAATGWLLFSTRKPDVS